MPSGESMSSVKTKSKLVEPKTVGTGGKNFASRGLTIIVRESVTFHFLIPRPVPTGYGRKVTINKLLF